MSRTAWAVAAAVAVHAAVLFGVRLDAPGPRSRREDTLVEVTLVAPREDAPPAPSAPAPRPPPRAAPPEPPPPARRPLAKRTPPPPPSPSPPAPSAEPSPRAIAPGTAEPSAAPAPGAPIPAPVPSLVTARPRYRRNPEPSYPLEARRRRQQGTVLLSVRVGAGGEPESIAVARSSGSAALDDAAVAAVKRWQFDPALQEGRPIASQVEIPIQFELR